MCDPYTGDEEFERAIRRIHKEQDNQKLIELCNILTALYKDDGSGCGYTKLNCPYNPPIRVKSRRRVDPNMLNPLNLLSPPKKARTNVVVPEKMDWGWNDLGVDYENPNLINDDSANFHGGKVDIYLKVKPNMNSGKALIQKLSDHNVRYLCRAAVEIIEDQNNITEKYEDVKFKHVYNSPSYENNEIFNKTLKQKLKSTQKDVFIAAYGQSGSGKSYLIMGDENKPQNEGLLDKTIDTIRNQKASSIKILSLQVYLGSTYNAFKGPDDLINNKEKDIILNWFKSKDSKKHIISAFNYLDMIDKDVPNKFVPENLQKSYGKDRCKYDDARLNYPPSRDIIHSLFERSTNDIEQLKNNDYLEALNVTTFDKEKIKHILKNNVYRPIRKMKLNTESSRSHLFTILQVVYPGGTEKLITFGDFGGLEDHNTSNLSVDIRRERKKLVNEGNRVFRRMVQSYTGGHDNNGRPKEWTCNNVIGYSKQQIGTPLVSTISSTLTTYDLPISYLDKIDKRNIQNNNDFKDLFESAAVFNIVRGTSGFFSQNDCEHIIYINIHGYANKRQEKQLCGTTNTVLKNAREFFGKG